MSASKAVQISGPQNKASKIKSILLKKKKSKKQEKKDLNEKYLNTL